MDVIITGGTGLLGNHLVPELVERGDSLRILALPGEDVSHLEEMGVVAYRGDIRDPETLRPLMRGADAVLHLAGMMGVWRPIGDYRAVNVVGTENVCRAAQAEGIGRIVHVSSWTIYGMSRGVVCDEELPAAPFPDPYAVTKAEGDRLVRELIVTEDLPAVIIRPGTFFGPGDRLHFGRMADRLRAARGVVVGRGDNALPFVYVTDVVQGILLGLDHPEAVGRTYNISTDAPLTQKEFLDATAAAVGGAAPRVHIPYHLLFAAGAAAEKVYARLLPERQPPLTRLGVNVFGTENRHAIDRAGSELGYRPRVSVREGIELTADWYLAKSLVA